MPVNINGQLNLGMFFNGLEFPIQPEVGRQIEICQNVKLHVPSVKIIASDIMRSFGSGSPINDGSLINILLHDVGNAASAAYYAFRAHGTPTRQTDKTGVARYAITGILDVLPYLRASPNQAFDGHSLSVMQTAAKTLGLILNSTVNNPQDNSTWRPGKMPWADFLTHIAAHAYVDATSVISKCVDLDKVLHFHNIVDLFHNFSPKAYLYHGAPQTLLTKIPSFNCVDWRAKNRSGASNIWSGYGQRTVQLAQDATSVVLNKVKASVFGNSLDINGDIAKAVGDVSRLVLSSVKSDNTHENYNTARHQNWRLLNTYTQNVYVMLVQASNLKLYDKVKFTQTDTNGLLNQVDSGEYIVTAKTQILDTNKYFEKLELTNAGPSNDSSSLAGAVSNIAYEIFNFGS